MSWTWQGVATLGMVLAAGAYLARAAWRQVRSRSSSAGCGSGCGGCPSRAGSEAAVPGPVVTIGLGPLNGKPDRPRPGP